MSQCKGLSRSLASCFAFQNCLFHLPGHFSFPMNRSVGLNVKRETAPRPTLRTFRGRQSQSGLGKRLLAPLLPVQTSLTSSSTSDKPSCCCGQTDDTRATNVCHLGQETHSAVLGSRQQKEAVMSSQRGMKGSGPRGRWADRVSQRCRQERELLKRLLCARHGLGTLLGFLPLIPTTPLRGSCSHFPT